MPFLITLATIFCFLKMPNLIKTNQNIKIGSGNFVIQGGFLKEDAGTEMTIPSDAGYYKLVYEIDLSKTNTTEEFALGNYKFVKR